MTCTPEENSASSLTENGILIANSSQQDSSSSRLVDQEIPYSRAILPCSLKSKASRLKRLLKSTKRPW